MGFFGTETSFSVPLDDDDDGTQRDTTLTRNAIFFLHFIFSLKLFRIINWNWITIVTFQFKNVLFYYIDLKERRAGHRPRHLSAWLGVISQRRNKPPIESHTQGIYFFFFFFSFFPRRKKILRMSDREREREWRMQSRCKRH